MAIETVRWVNNHIRLIDQRKLPTKFQYLNCRDVHTLWQAIKQLSVRGAPAIGVAAAYGVVLGANKFKGKDRTRFFQHVRKTSKYLASSRPTAVDLFNALERMLGILSENPALSVDQLKKKLKKEADLIRHEDRMACRMMGEYGAGLVKNGQNLLTICNAGALATVDYGTAAGVFYSAKKRKKKFSVYACETRPLLQGARLTTWELMRSKIRTTLICDSMAATLMKQGKINAVFTGADRVAMNGDAANKIGTYSLAVLAKHHKIPFYIVAPYSTFDFKTKTGREIPIEERHADEVKYFMKQQTAPKNVKVYNPAFDVTDSKLITAIITNRGVIRPPFITNIRKTFKSKNYGKR